MKRAILVSSGTLAGLVAVLTYSGGDTLPASAAGAGAAGLGGPPPLGSTDQATTAPSGGVRGATGATGGAGPASPAPPAPAAGAISAAPPKAATPGATTPAVKPPPTASKAAAPKPAPRPASTKAAAPKPTPTPTPTKAATPAGPKDYIGSLQTHKYGQVQVGIRVQGGKIIAVWPVVYPDGNSQPYSDFSIPVLESETMAAQSANIATVSGATLTWQSWTTSLQSALAKAGL